MALVALVALLAIGFFVAFGIGTNDETMSPAVGAHVFSAGTAVLLGAVVNLFGAVFMGSAVSEKVGSELVRGNVLTMDMVFAILISMAIWLIMASASHGIPISTTQCIVGSVIGVCLIAPFLGLPSWGLQSIDFLVLLQVFLGWIISPMVGFFIAAVIFFLVRKAQDRANGFYARERQETIAAYALAVFLIITSLSRGGNDVANAVAPLMALPEFNMVYHFGFLTIPGTLMPLVVGGIGMGLGLIIVGGKVIRTVSTEIVTLSPSSALSASIAVSFIMLIGTVLGLPLSGTHVLVASLIAVGWVEQTEIQKKQIRDIIISWVITVPISAFFAILCFCGIHHLF
ncbi:MAG: anion permease [Candidatus Thorarchaeota archaeon]